MLCGRNVTLLAHIFIRAHTCTRAAHRRARQSVREAFRLRYFSHIAFVLTSHGACIMGLRTLVLIPSKIGGSPRRLSGFRFPQKEGLVAALKGRKLKGAKKGRGIKREVKQFRNVQVVFLPAVMPITFSHSVSFRKIQRRARDCLFLIN